jgi:hypothetical protein
MMMKYISYIYLFMFISVHSIICEEEFKQNSWYCHSQLTKLTNQLTNYRRTEYISTAKTKTKPRLFPYDIIRQGRKCFSKLLSQLYSCIYCYYYCVKDINSVDFLTHSKTLIDLLIHPIASPHLVIIDTQSYLQIHFVMIVL